MKIILAIGNPEQRYDNTRHNVGFWYIDQYAATTNASFKQQLKFNALIAEFSVDGNKVLLVKPTTYYNEVGVSARALMDFYKLSPTDFLIIHDDLALPLGTVRTRIGGSDGGNNGIKSLNAHLGTDTARVRIGVWTELHHGVDKVATVLGKFSKAEISTLAAVRPTIDDHLTHFIHGTFETTTHRHDTEI